MSPDHCPGSEFIRTPTLTVKTCPECGAEVEVFSNDASVRCEGCGFEVYNDLKSCIQWCEHAGECVGPEVVERLKRALEEE